MTETVASFMANYKRIRGIFWQVSPKPVIVDPMRNKKALILIRPKDKLPKFPVIENPVVYNTENGGPQDEEKGRAILEDISEFMKVKSCDIINKGKSKEIVMARHLVMWCMRYETRLSIQQIGNMLNIIYLSTIIKGVDKINNLIAEKKIIIKISG